MKIKYLFLICICFYSLPIFSQVISYQFNPDKIDKKLATQMDSIFQEDQQCRLIWMKLRDERKTQCSIDSIVKIAKQKDKENLNFVKDFIGKYGWLGMDVLGFQGAQGLFLVIQHANLKTQKKYYPIIKKAEKEGKVLSSNVAILEDRIAVREGKKQTYGSQGYYDEVKQKTFTYPIKDINKLDSLRKQVGLQPMKEYDKNWDVEDYKANLPYAKELLKKSKGKNKN